MLEVQLTFPDCFWCTDHMCATRDHDAGFVPPTKSLCFALQAYKVFYETERRHVYTTPKTFLELIKLYKSTLARKRKESQEAIDR